MVRIFADLYIIINKQSVHVRPSDFNDLSTVETLKVLHDECSTPQLDESLGEVRSILFGQQKDQSKDIGLSVFEFVCACVTASVWNNV